MRKWLEGIVFVGLVLVVLILTMGVAFAEGIKVSQDPGTGGDWPIWTSIGEKTGWSRVAMSGHNDAITTAYESIWPLGGSYSYCTTATVVWVSSTSANDVTNGTGVKTVLISGLDVGYTQQTETVSMNGTNAVATTQSFYRVNAATAVTVGSGGVNAGDIYISETNGQTYADGAVANTNLVFAFIEAGEGMAHQSIYTVPACCTAYLTSSFVTIGATATSWGSWKLKVRQYGKSWLIAGETYISTAGPLILQPKMFPTFPAKTDIEQRHKAASGTQSATGNLEFLLIAD